MLLEGCQGKKGPQLWEQPCPNCGAPVEMASGDVSALCEVCGALVWSEQMDCAFRCPHARECVGEAQYARLEQAREQRRRQAERQYSEDEW